MIIEEIRQHFTTILLIVLTVTVASLLLAVKSLRERVALLERNTGEKKDRPEGEIEQLRDDR